MYIDVDIAKEKGIIGKVSVLVDGKRLDRCISAKDGKNGYVECYATINEIPKGAIDIPIITHKGYVEIIIDD